MHLAWKAFAPASIAMNRVAPAMKSYRALESTHHVNEPVSHIIS